MAPTPTNKYEKTYLGPLTADETEMLYRMVCLGILSGDQKVKSSLFNKVALAQENAKLGRAWLCTRDILETQKADGKKQKAESVS
jgi:hypothetical protein